MPAPTASSPIDVVDDQNIPIGTVPRGEALSHELNFRTVHVLVLDESGDHLLVQHLGEHRDRHRGLIGSSVAGYLHAGEDYEGGARRRLWEELSVEGDPRRVGVVSLADGPATKFVGVFVFSTSRATEFVLLEGHVARVDWDSLEHLKNAMNDFPETYTETFRQVFAYLIGHI